MKEMNLVFLAWLLLVLAFAISCKEQTSVSTTSVQVDAPFEMPDIIIPDFSKTKSFLITEFGAVPGDNGKTTQAIARAIDQAAVAGGGSVIVPPGEWITGKIHLKSNVNLHLEKGAVLLFSEDPADYLPAVKSTWEGMECYNYSPLIYAYECKNVAISGKGELKAQMHIWESWFGRPKPHMESLKALYNMAYKDIPVEERQMANDSAHFRPQFIQFNRCENVLLEAVTITNSPFWVIHPFMSKNVVIRDVSVFAHGHNNYGVDPEMSQNVLIENCVFDQGDDAIAIKSGRNHDAWRLNTPSKNIVIRNCTVKNGHQLLALGSELSGGVENVYMENCQVVQGADLRHLLFVKTNERRGGYVRNIFLKNINSGDIKNGVLGIETDVLYQWRDLVPTYDRKLTSIKDIFIEDITTGTIRFISSIQGDPQMPIEHVALLNIEIDSVLGDSLIHSNIVGFSLESEN